MAAANGARPAAPARSCCWWLHRADDTLHVADRIAWFAHATAPAGMAVPTPSGPPHRLALRAVPQGKLTL